jgi:TetR/AcrR family transcriptional regulator
MTQLNKKPRQLRAARSSRSADTEQRILDAAHAVFVRRGTAGARMQEIAAEAGVNQALLHYYFRSKEQLARAAFERAGSQLMPAIVRAMGSEAAAEIRPRVFGVLKRQIAARVAAGEMRPITAESFMVNLVSLCIFPFAARPMLQAMLGLDQAGFARFIARRRTDLVEFFLGALRP